MPEPTSLSQQLEDHLSREYADVQLDLTAYQGEDWWQYTLADEEVFGIAAARWPRMMYAWSCYEAFKQIADVTTWDDALIAAARAAHPEWCGPYTDQTEFMNFAKAFGGLSHRESYAMFWKNDAWRVRCGVTTFKDGS